MKSKAQKKEELKKVEKKIPEAVITIFTTFSREGEKGLTVPQTQELRRALRGVQSEYMTTKKTLLEIALRDLKYDGIDVYSMDGSMGLVMGKSDNPEDAYAICKVLYDFAKKHPMLKFFGALYGGKFVGREHFIEMATMPSWEVLLVRLMWMLQYPATSLASVLWQIAEKKQGEQTTA